MTITNKWRYEEATKTIRSVPENYWIATMDSWEGAVDHTHNAELIAKAPEMRGLLRDLLQALNNLHDEQDANGNVNLAWRYLPLMGAAHRLLDGK